MNAPLLQSHSKDSVSEPSSSSSSLWLYFKLTRLHKFPAGSILVFWPCAWGLTMGALGHKVPPQELALKLVMYFLGSTLRHNAACIWNDMCDREFDRKVERSKNRPLASGAVSMLGASVLLLVHILACLVLLILDGPMVTKAGLIGLFFIDPLYPLMKRWTYWPQAWLGLAMTWGLPVCWISVTGSINWKVACALFVGGVCWTIHYDTIYACQDRRDDVDAGVKSTVVLFGDYVRPILSVFSAIFVGCLVASGIFNGNGAIYFSVTVIGGALHLIWQLSTVNLDDGAACWKTFKANGNTLGFILWVGMFVDIFHRSGWSG